MGRDLQPLADVVEAYIENDEAEKFLLELQGVVEELRRAEKEGN